MTQDIIVYILILLAVGKVFYSTVKLIMPVKKTEPPFCDGCSGCTSLKQANMRNRAL